MSVRMWKKQPS